jgi:hypothetical protein
MKMEEKMKRTIVKMGLGVTIIFSGCANWNQDTASGNSTINKNENYQFSPTIMLHKDLNQLLIEKFKNIWNKKDISVDNKTQKDFLYIRNRNNQIISMNQISKISIEEPLRYSEQFSSGKYLLPKNNVKALMQTVFQYIQSAGHTVEEQGYKKYEFIINILGTSDGAGYDKELNIQYRGDFGNSISMQVKNDNTKQLTMVNLKKGQRFTNFTLATMRALYGKELLADTLKMANLEYDSDKISLSTLSAREYKEVGKEYRRLDITITLHILNEK